MTAPRQEWCVGGKMAVPVVLLLFSIFFVVTSAQYNYEDSDNFACPACFGHFPHLTNQSCYYECSWYKPHLKVCPDGLMYNDTIKVCDWPPNHHGGCQDPWATTTVPTPKYTSSISGNKIMCCDGSDPNCQGPPCDQNQNQNFSPRNSFLGQQSGVQDCGNLNACFYDSEGKHSRIKCCNNSGDNPNEIRLDLQIDTTMNLNDIVKAIFSCINSTVDGDKGLDHSRLINVMMQCTENGGFGNLKTNLAPEDLSNIMDYTEQGFTTPSDEYTPVVKIIQSNANCINFSVSCVPNVMRITTTTTSNYIQPTDSALLNHGYNNPQQPENQIPQSMSLEQSQNSAVEPSAFTPMQPAFQPPITIVNNPNYYSQENNPPINPPTGYDGTQNTNSNNGANSAGTDNVMYQPVPNQGTLVFIPNENVYTLPPPSSAPQTGHFSARFGMMDSNANPPVMQYLRADQIQPYQPINPNQISIESSQNMGNLQQVNEPEAVYYQQPPYIPNLPPQNTEQQQPPQFVNTYLQNSAGNPMYAPYNSGGYIAVPVNSGQPAQVLYTSNSGKSASSENSSPQNPPQYYQEPPNYGSGQLYSRENLNPPPIIQTQPVYVNSAGQYVSGERPIENNYPSSQSTETQGTPFNLDGKVYMLPPNTYVAPQAPMGNGQTYVSNESPPQNLQPVFVPNTPQYQQNNFANSAPQSTEQQLQPIYSYNNNGQVVIQNQPSDTMAPPQIQYINGPASSQINPNPPVQYIGTQQGQPIYVIPSSQGEPVQNVAQYVLTSQNTENLHPYHANIVPIDQNQQQQPQQFYTSSSSQSGDSSSSIDTSSQNVQYAQPIYVVPITNSNDQANNNVQAPQVTEQQIPTLNNIQVPTYSSEGIANGNAQAVYVPVQQVPTSSGDTNNGNLPAAYVPIQQIPAYSGETSNGNAQAMYVPVQQVPTYTAETNNGNLPAGYVPIQQIPAYSGETSDGNAQAVYVPVQQVPTYTAETNNGNLPTGYVPIQQIPTYSGETSNGNVQGAYVPIQQNPTGEISNGNAQTVYVPVQQFPTYSGETNNGNLPTAFVPVQQIPTGETSNGNVQGAYVPVQQPPTYSAEGSNTGNVPPGYLPVQQIPTYPGETNNGNIMYVPAQPPAQFPSPVLISPESQLISSEQSSNINTPSQNTDPVFILHNGNLYSAERTSDGGLPTVISSSNEMPVQPVYVSGQNISPDQISNPVNPPVYIPNPQQDQSGGGSSSPSETSYPAPSSNEQAPQQSVDQQTNTGGGYVPELQPGQPVYITTGSQGTLVHQAQQGDGLPQVIASQESSQSAENPSGQSISQESDQSRQSIQNEGNIVIQIPQPGGVSSQFHNPPIQSQEVSPYIRNNNVPQGQQGSMEGIARNNAPRYCCPTCGRCAAQCTPQCCAPACCTCGCTHCAPQPCVQCPSTCCYGQWPSLAEQQHMDSTWEQNMRTMDRQMKYIDQIYGPNALQSRPQYYY